MSELIPLPGGMSVLHNPPTGTCYQCAVAHEPTMPHNAQSLAYQYYFYGKNGRWPTWEDAMAEDLRGDANARVGVAAKLGEIQQAMDALMVNKPKRAISLEDAA